MPVEPEQLLERIALDSCEHREVGQSPLSTDNSLPRKEVTCLSHKQPRQDLNVSV